MYRLITHSKLSSAEQFESWVFDSVLPTIRKHGMYATDDLLNNPDLLIEVATKLKLEQERNKSLQEDVNRMKPKEIFADAVSASHTLILIGDLAKLLKQNGVGTGQKRLFEQLRDEGFLMKEGSSKNMPTQRAMEMGLFEVKEGSYIDSNGCNITTRTTKVTGKGQQYFIHRFLSRNVISA